MARLLPSTPPVVRSTASLSSANTKAMTKTVRVSSTTARTRVSEAEYWEKYYDYVGPEDHHYEWNNGYLEEKPMADYVSCLMYDWFKILLREYLQTQPVAKMISLEMGFRLALPHQTVIRKPDLGVVLNSNPVPLGPIDQSYRGIFDVCLESLSYSNLGEVKRDLVTKKREYAQGGVKEYYILDARGEQTACYQLTTGGLYTPILPSPEGVIRSNVLPGFQFRFTDLSQQPTLTEMSEDPVYRAFALPALHAERQARQLAESQAQIAREAQQVAESQAQAAREAQQVAEAEVQVEKEARQAMAAKLQQLEEELARLRQSK